MDMRTGNPKVWVNRDKQSGRVKGDATVAYENIQSANEAIARYNSTWAH